jgi:AcrR family transcriptional regulator
MMDMTEMQQSDGTRGPGRPRCNVRRECILEAAYALLAEKGLTGFTIEAVAARSGSAKTTIYRWWPSKGALAMEAALTVAREAAPLIPPESGKAVDALRVHMHNLSVLFASSYGRVVSGIIAEGQSDPDVLALYRRELFDQRRAEAGKIFQHGIKNGEFPPDLDITLALDLIYSCFYTRLLLKHEPLDDQEWVDRLFDRVLHGIAAPRSARVKEKVDA